jgi:hypothetical protein
MTDSRTTKLEIGLFAWTAISVAIGIWVIATRPLQLFGSGFAALLPPVGWLLATGFLLWGLRRPTRLILMFGAFFWALQIVSVRFQDALYSFRLGLSINFRVVDNPLVTINLLAIPVAILFALAASRRDDARDAVSTP